MTEVFIVIYCSAKHNMHVGTGVSVIKIIKINTIEVNILSPSFILVSLKEVTNIGMLFVSRMLPTMYQVFVFNMRDKID